MLTVRFKMMGINNLAMTTTSGYFNQWWALLILLSIQYLDASCLFDNSTSWKNLDNFFTLDAEMLLIHNIRILLAYMTP